MKEMETKNRKEDLIIETATKILTSDIQNGYRNYWIDELTDEKIDKIVLRSIKIAEKLVNKVIV